MEETSISLDLTKYSCVVCLHLLKDPVATSCGHSFCMDCINGYWDHEDQGGVYSCPQCRETFTSRPVLRRNNMLTEVVDKLKTTEHQAASADHSYAGSGDVECDFCTGTKSKAVKSCLMCVAAFCETHLKPHLDFPALKRHTLIKASTKLREKICSHHNEVLKIYCCTDQRCICYLCMMDEHRGHDTVSAAAERTKKQNELEQEQRKFHQKVQEKQKVVQELKQTVINIKHSAQTAVEDSERIFSEMINSLEKKQSEVTELIRAHEKSELNRVEKLLQELEQEIADLNRRTTELEKLLHIQDHIHFLQGFQSLSVSSRCEDTPSIILHQHFSFYGVRKSLSDLRERLEDFCKEDFNSTSEHETDISNDVEACNTSPLEPKCREDFLKYFCYLTLDPNTANSYLRLSENNRVVTDSETKQPYPDHPERFDHCGQVLSKESLCGRCYWEVERSSQEWVSISVSYKGISRKGKREQCGFGYNNRSWSLWCSSSSLCFCHNNIKTTIAGPSHSRIGVYVDHGAGTLSSYSVSDSMRLLHRVQTKFTQALYAGFWVDFGSVKLRDLNK